MKRVNRTLRTLVLSAILMTVALPAFAQTDELTLFVRRNFGYGGGDQIQGSFRMEATGPSDLANVTFKVDDQIVSTVASAPFKVNFNAFSTRAHSLS